LFLSAYMTISQNFLHTTAHEWLQALPDGTFAVGISDAGQAMLGDIVFCGEAAVGQHLNVGETCAVVESVKAASDVHMPIAGQVLAFNEDINNDPTVLNTAAYATWIVKIRPSASADLSCLMSATDYQQQL
jgi:glycine cleavage system H protein